MDVRVESKLCTDLVVHGLFLMSRRSVQQVTDRLDKLIWRIKDIQRLHMHGRNPADIVIVCFPVLPPQALLMLFVRINQCELQVAHGLILRCLVQRWLGHQIPDGLPMIFEPGAVGILRYVCF